MASPKKLKKIHSKIQLLKSTAVELNRLGENIPFLARNSIRILASIKMMEINISDLMELYDPKKGED